MRICVIGGGISGLSAAHYLTDTDDHEVTILEAAPVLGGRANVTDDGEHCTRVFLDDYHYLNDLLADVPTAEGRSLLDTLLPAQRFARARDGRWVRIDHIYAFLSRTGGLTVQDKASILTSNRRSLLAAIDADRWKRCADSQGPRRWTLRLPSQNPQPDVTSTNRYGSLWNWSPAGLYRALHSAWSSSDAFVLSGCTERHLIRPWVEFLQHRRVTVRTDCLVDRIEPAADTVQVTVAGTTESFDLVLVATFAHDAYQLLDRSGHPRPLDHRTHTHFKALTIGLDAREPVLADSSSRIFASSGISTIVQPGESRCVCMAAYLGRRTASSCSTSSASSCRCSTIPVTCSSARTWSRARRCSSVTTSTPGSWRCR